MPARLNTRQVLRPRALLCFAILIALSLGCSPRNTRNYQAGGAALGVAAVHAVGYRAITGNCYAICTPGNVCDRQTGFCVPSECSPACADGQRCQRDLDGRLYCEDDGLTLSLMKASRAASFDAGTFSAGADGGVP